MTKTEKALKFLSLFYVTTSAALFSSGPTFSLVLLLLLMYTLPFLYLASLNSRWALVFLPHTCKLEQCSIFFLGYLSLFSYSAFLMFEFIRSTFSLVWAFCHLCLIFCPLGYFLSMEEVNLESKHYLNRNEYRAIILFSFFSYSEVACLGRFKFTHISTEGNYSSSEMFLQILLQEQKKSFKKHL